MNGVIIGSGRSPSPASTPQESKELPWYERIAEIIESIFRALSQAIPSDAAGSGFGYSAAATPSARSALEGCDGAAAAFDSSIAGKAPAATMNHSQDKNVVKKNGATVDSFDKLFPPCRESLPKDLDWLENQKKGLNGGIDTFEELDSAWKIESISVKNHFVIPLRELEKQSKSPSIGTIKDCLLQHNPLFAKAYALASQPLVSESVLAI